MRFLLTSLLLVIGVGADAAEPRLGFTLLGGWSPLHVKGSAGYDLGCCAKAYQAQEVHGSLLTGGGIEYRLGANTALEAFLSAAPWHARKREPNDLRISVVRESAGCPTTAPPFACIDQPRGTLSELMNGEWARPDGTLRTYHADVALRHELGGHATRAFFSLGLGRLAYGGDRNGFQGDWSLVAGTGVFAHLSRRARLRIDLTDHVVRRHFVRGGTAHDVHLRVGLAVR